MVSIVPTLTGTSAWGQSSEEIIVSGRRAAAAVPVVLDCFRPRDLSDIARGLPTTVTSVNSRGESFVSIRARGERETTLVLDGVPVVDPWDQRVDVAQLPAGLVGSVVVEPLGNAKYTSGSAVRVSSAADAPSSADIMLGDLGFSRLSARLRSEKRIIAFETVHRDAEPVPADLALHFQPSNQGRINTHQQRHSVYARDELRVGAWSLAASALLNDSEYGLAPEGHLSAQDARFWRVPEDRRVFLSASASRPLGQGAVGLSAWRHKTEKAINAYTDEMFDTLADVQRNDGSSLGFLANYEQPGIALGLSQQQLRHEQQDEGTPSRKFQRKVQAAWLEAGGRLSAKVGWSASSRVEGYTTERAGGRSVLSDQSLTTGRVKLASLGSSPWQWQASVARLGRLPSQRELFGGALGRFVVNPDLKPEIGHVVSASLERSGMAWSARVEPYVEVWDSVIDQRTLVSSAVLQRQRFNADGYQAVGLDFLGSAQLSRAWSVEGVATLSDRSRNDRGEPLTERPETFGTMLLRFKPNAFGAEVILRQRGSVRSFGAVGEPVTLPGRAILGLEVNYETDRFAAFARVDNAADEVLFPQAGLPEPGRFWRVGLTLFSS